MTGFDPMATWEERDRAASSAGASATLARDLNGVLGMIAANIALAERHAAGNPRLIRLLNTMRVATERGTALAATLTAAEPAYAYGPGASEETDSLRPPRANSRVLVVESDAGVVRHVIAVLEGMGHSAEVRADAGEALALLGTGAAFDLVVSEIVLPGGMDGVELAEAVAVRFPKLPVLLATGNSGAALSPGALGFPVVAKPFTTPELTRRIGQMLPQD